LCRLAADYPDKIVTTPKSRHGYSSCPLKHLHECAPLIDRGRERAIFALCDQVRLGHLVLATKWSIWLAGTKYLGAESR
ncbi:hypothetical protein KCU99_g68, partial [Aureobasidium melanogenum]